MNQSWERLFSYGYIPGEMRLQRKAVVVGDKGCGKSNLVALIQGKPFQEEYTPTAFDTAELKIKTQVKAQSAKNGEKGT